MQKTMTSKLRYILILLLGMVFMNSGAQNSQVLYNMNVPQRHFLNPALTPTNSVYIGLPAISGINLNINNNFMNFSDVFMKSKTTDSLISILHPEYDVQDFIPKINDKNSIEPQVLIQLFGLGFRAGEDLYIFFDVNDRIESNIVLPGDIMKLALLGNEQFMGDKIDLSSLRADVKYFREYGLGFSKDITDKLRIGVKGKLYSGVASAAIENNSLGITVNSDYTHSIDADMMVNFSGPVTAYVNSDNTIDSISFDSNKLDFENVSEVINYLLKPENKGFGFDVGAEYSFSDKLRLSASFTDIGYIRWKRDITSLRAKSSFVFSGLDLSDVYKRDITIDSLAAELLDSLKNSFSIDNTHNPFTTYMPFGVTIGGSYNITKGFSLGLLSYSRFVGKQLREALTVSANINLGNAFTTSIAYTAANQRYDNLGAGLAFRAGWFQLYMLADRIPVTWNKFETKSNSFILPASWNTVHFRIGMNLAFGNKIKKKSDQPMIINEPVIPEK